MAGVADARPGAGAAEVLGGSERFTFTSCTPNGLVVVGATVVVAGAAGVVAGRLVVTASAPVVGTAVVAAGTAVLVTGAAVVAAAVGTAVVVVVAAMLVTGAAVGSAGAGAGARQLRKVLGWMMTATSRKRSEVDMHNVPRQVALGSGIAACVVLSELNSGHVWCCQSLLLKRGIERQAMQVLCN